MAGKKVPKHIAVIMDGNGRWARKRGLPRSAGHYQGFRTLEKITEACADRGVRYLTVYAFSTENWSRPQREVSYLMGLIIRYIDEITAKFMKSGVRMNVYGDLSGVESRLRTKIEGAIRKTAGNRKFTLNIAFNYGGRDEIIRAIRRWSSSRAGRKVAPKLTEKAFRRYLDHPEIPDPELLIRTGGEIRISNFLLWELSYSELYFTGVFWPDFNGRELDRAIAWYGDRERRFGGVKGG